MGDQSKNALIGVFVVTACAIAILLLLFIHPRVGDEGRILHVRFANIDKVNIGTRVTYAGNPVGEVVEIKEILPPQNPRPDHEGFVYPYELTLKVDSSVHVYNSDTVSLRTSGLLGEKSVAITPLPPAPGQTLQLVDDKVIYAYETGSVEETLKEFKELADKFESALEAVTTTFSDINKSHLVDHVSKTFENIQNITKAIDQPEKYKQILDNAHTFADKAVKSIDKFDKTLETIDQTAANFKEFSATGVKIGNQVATVMDKVVSGEGTIGRLFMKDDLYLRTTSILSKAETLADDVNHYGLLFHLDKDWQKLRARRANLLQKLSTPQQFRNYFNDEIDKITTSLTRVSQVMQETESIDPYGELGEDQNFKKVFSELLRRVTALEESLQMYNQQLEEVSVQETELTPSPMEYCQ